jgi:hypothetical protein
MYIFHKQTVQIYVNGDDEIIRSWPQFVCWFETFFQQTEPDDIVSVQENVRDSKIQ